jgi:Ca2+-transporting ATPase
MEKAYLKNASEVIKELNSNEITGLTNDQVLINKEQYGENKLKDKGKTSLIVRFLQSLLDPLILILIIAATVSLMVSGLIEKHISPEEWFESAIIVLVVVLNSIIGIMQQSKAEKSLDALKKMSSPLTGVVRNGVEDLIPTSEIVVGDILLLEAGDILPADSRLIECANLKVDESALTGESVPIDKTSDTLLEETLSLGDRHNILFSSTPITNGRAKAIVFSVGMDTQVGKIATMLLDDNNQSTPLQIKLAQVGKVISWLCLIVSVLVFVLEILAESITSAITVSSLLEAFKSAIALAVAVIPEGLATVITIVLALGVSKMAKANAIVKKLPAVETLGSTSVVCSDKTGTLTLNKMSVVKIYKDKLIDAKDCKKDYSKFISYFALCSDAKIIVEDNEERSIGDPTELALIHLNNKSGLNIDGIERVGEIPFDSERKLMTVIVKIDNQLISITKGAPDVIISKGTIDTNQDKDKAMSNFIKVNNQLADNALRVLGLGIKYLDSIPEDLSTLEDNLLIQGMVGMIDPPRSEVKSAIEEAKKAGIKTVMITGDYISTAKAIASQLGILNPGDKAISSKELSTLSDEYLLEHISEYSVYARVNPSDKVRIVNIWQKNNRVVAMTGDGVNDSPALKRADIGCAMGITGTNVTKEVADMVLMDDNYSTIILAIKEGRNIYSNLKKCVKYLLASNIGEALTIFAVSLIAVIIGSNIGVPLAPIHLLWINLITDSLPAFALGMEKAENDVMDHKPRDKNEGFFAHGLGIEIIIQGIFIGGITIAAFFLGLKVFNNEVIGQTMAFFTLSGTQLFHSFNIKSSHSIFSKSTFNNRFLILSFLVGFGLQFLVIYTPGLNNLFGFTALSILPLLISIILGASTILLSEIMKIIDNKIEVKKGK